MCVLWSAGSLLKAYRGKGKVSFQISRLDSKAGMGLISLHYCCTNLCSIFGHERQHCCGYVHWCDGREVQIICVLVVTCDVYRCDVRTVKRYACRLSHAMRTVPRCVWSLLHTSLLNQ